MPLDPFDAPVVARAVNDEMSRVKLAGTSASVKAAVSMEVAQLAIECIQPTPACYRRGRTFAGRRPLDVGARSIRGPTRRFGHRRAVRRRRGQLDSRRVGTFDGAQAARAGVAELVAHAAQAGSRTP